MSARAVTELDVSNTSDRAARHLPVPIPHGILEVVDGVHRGASIVIDKGVLSLGSTVEADVTLSDSGVAQRHGIVRLQGETVVIEAVGGDIGVGRNFRIPRGHGCRTRLPVVLRLGDAVIQIARSRTRRTRSAVPRWAGVAATCCAVLLVSWHVGLDSIVPPGTFTDLMGRAAASSNASLSAPYSPANITGTVQAAAAPLPVTTPPLHVTPDAAIEALRSQLSAKGLSDIAAKPEGHRVVASGTVSADQREAWSDVQRWFDRTYGGRVVLASAVVARPLETNPKFDLQGISFSETPYVITGDGQRRYTGAVLDRGWVIKEIGAGGLKLSKDGRELVLGF